MWRNCESLCSALWHTPWDYFPPPSLATQPQSFQDFFPMKVQVQRELSMCFLCTHGKKLASFICRSVHQMVAGRGSGCVRPEDRAEKGTLKNTLAPGGTRHVLKVGLCKTVMPVIFHHHVSRTWLGFPNKAPVE